MLPLITHTYPCTVTVGQPRCLTLSVNEQRQKVMEVAVKHVTSHHSISSVSFVISSHLIRLFVQNTPSCHKTVGKQDRHQLTDRPLTGKLPHEKTLLAFACERTTMAHSRHLVPLLPHISGSSSSEAQARPIDSGRFRIPKRTSVAVACEYCRQRKVRVSDYQWSGRVRMNRVPSPVRLVLVHRRVLTSLEYLSATALGLNVRYALNMGGNASTLAKRAIRYPVASIMHHSADWPHWKSCSTF